MDARRIFRRHPLNKRQGLGGALGGLVPDPTSSTASTVPTTSPPSQNTVNPSDPGGTSSSLTSLSTPASSSGPSSVISSTSLTFSGSTNSTPLSPVQTTPPSSTSSSTTSSTDSPPTFTPTLTPNPSSSGDVVYTSSDGTKVVYITSTLPVPSATKPPVSFLANPSLEGGVFALVGIAVLIIIFIAATCVIRKRRRQRLERDLAVAVTFDPGATDQYERQENLIGKRELSGSSSGHSHGRGRYGSYTGQPAYAPEYHTAISYPAPVVYRTPSQTSVPYLPSSSGSQQPSWQSGANLTRKFSDRKPVPPLPYPTSDPTVPSQFY